MYIIYVRYKRVAVWSCGKAPDSRGSSSSDHRNFYIPNCTPRTSGARAEKLGYLSEEKLNLKLVVKLGELGSFGTKLALVHLIHALTYAHVNHDNPEKVQGKCLVLINRTLFFNVFGGEMYFGGEMEKLNLNVLLCI